MFYSYKKTIRTTTTTAEGKTVEEVVEQCEGPEAKAKMEQAEKAGNKLDETFKKMDRFFDKMGEAFKELW